MAGILRGGTGQGQKWQKGSPLPLELQENEVRWGGVLVTSKTQGPIFFVENYSGQRGSGEHRGLCRKWSPFLLQPES